MTAVIVILIILAVLVIISLLRFGAEFEYSAEGTFLNCVCGPVKIRLIPRTDKPKKEKKKKKEKADKQKKQKKTKKSEVAGEKKGGTLEKVKTVLPTVLRTVGRFFRHIQIDELTVRAYLTGDDPCDTALRYGYVSAGLGYLVPIIKRNFKVKKWNVSVMPSFTDDTEETVYIKAKATIALWEIIYIILKLDFKAIFSILK